MRRLEPRFVLRGWWWWLWTFALERGLAKKVVEEGVRSCHLEDTEKYEYACPTHRYCDWRGTTHPRRVRDALRSDLGYTARGWSFEDDANPRERAPFAALDATAQRAYERIGYGAVEHDCCLAHFEGTAWDALPLDTRTALSAVGLDRFAWSEGVGVAAVVAEPSWDALSAAARAALEALCHSRETWERAPLPWTRDDDDALVLPGQRPRSIAPGTRTTTPSSTPTTYAAPPAIASAPSCFDGRLDPDRVAYFCPARRYCGWDRHDVSVRLLLGIKVGYRPSGWNYVAPSPIDDSHWAGLPREARRGLRALGYDEDRHDCCNHHYWDYDWTELQQPGYEDVLRAVRSIGYRDETSWISDEWVEYLDYWWEELPPDVAEALFRGMCYTKETWNFESLPAWPSDATLPGSYDHATVLD